MSLWLILGKFVNIPTVDVFLIGCYSGNKKPNNTYSYLHNFIYEINFLKNNGVNLYGKNIRISVRIMALQQISQLMLLKIIYSIKKIFVVQAKF